MIEAQKITDGMEGIKDGARHIDPEKAFMWAEAAFKFAKKHVNDLKADKLLKAIGVQRRPSTAAKLGSIWVFDTR